MSAAPASIPGMVKIVTGALIREGRVLLAHRSPTRSAYPDVWDLPGGHVETGESELEALARELREELGVQVSVDSAVHLCRFSAGAGGTVLFSAWLVGEWLGTPTNVDPVEHDSLRWLADELPSLAHAHVRTPLVDAIAAEGSAPD